MMLTVRRRCASRTAKGEPCQATPRGESGLCLWHDPALTEAAKEARRLGGQRRKREITVQAAYDVEGLGSLTQIRRLVEIAVTDLLGVENTVQRARALLTAAQVASGLLERNELESRIAALESALGPRLRREQEER